MQNCHLFADVQYMQTNLSRMIVWSLEPLLDNHFDVDLKRQNKTH